MFFSNNHLYDIWCVGLDFIIFIFILYDIVKVNFGVFFIDFILIPFPRYINDDLESAE